MELKLTSSPKPVGPKGPKNARILIVGEAPGAEEERQSLPFVEPAGNLLDGLLNSIGLEPADIFFTNLCKIRPPGNELKAYCSAEGIPQGHLLDGLKELQQEISQVNPNVIIPLGNFPLKFLTGRGKWDKKHGTYTGIGSYRGYVLAGTALAGGRKCLPTYHPAAILRNYPLKHIARLDLSRAVTEQGFPEIRYPNKCLINDPRGADRQSWAEWLVSSPGTLSPPFTYSQGPASNLAQIPIQVPSRPFGSGDIEGTGDRLYCIGFTRHPDVAVNFLTKNRDDIAFIRGICESGIPWCFQNGNFDCSLLEWFHNVLIYDHLKHDTMYGMHAAYTEWPKDLGFIGSLFALQHPWWEEVDAAFWKKVAAGALDKEDIIQALLTYNNHDVWNTQNAMEALLDDELIDPNYLNTYLHEMALVLPLWRIARRGVPINTEALATLRTTLDKELVTLGIGLAHLNNGQVLNVKSGPQKAKFLFSVLGISPLGVPKTPGGEFKMDDTTLANIQLKVKDERQRQAIKMVRAATERRDLISKFCEIDLDTDGRIRCHYDPAKTDTGRLSSRKFNPTGNGANLQNQPRDTRVRAVFVPDKGYIFGYADLKSAESMVVSHITGDPKMLELHTPEYLDGGLDGHKFVASFLLDRPIELITKEERYLGKRVRHAGNYGMSWFKLMQLINADAQETGVSVDAAQAKLLIQKYRQLHPFLEVWWNDILTQLYATHTIYTLHGRKRVFYDRPDNILPEAIAYNPQGTVGQTLNMGLLRCDPDYHITPHNWQRQWDLRNIDVQLQNLRIEQSGLLQESGFQMLLQIHDAIGFQIPEKNADAVLPLIPELMKIPIPIKRKGLDPYNLIIPTDLQVGYNWGESDEDKPGTGLTKKGQPAINPNGLKAYKYVKSLPASTT